MPALEDEELYRRLVQLDHTIKPMIATELLRAAIILFRTYFLVLHPARAVV